MNDEVTVVCPVSFRVGESGRKRMKPEADDGRAAIPRVAKLMALALRFDWLVRNGIVENNSDLARLGGVSFSRVTQIMNLLYLAPDIQEELLFLQRTPEGHDPLGEYDLRPLAAEAEWSKQRELWAELRSG